MVIWVIKTFFAYYLFCVFLPPLLNIFLLLLGPYHFCLYCTHLFMKDGISNIIGISSIIEEISDLSRSIFFPLFLCIIHLKRLSYLSLLFSGTLHSVKYIFPFLLFLSHLFFSQLFVRPPQTNTLPSCISFSLG